MGLKQDLEDQVKAIFKDAWETRDGTVVPIDSSVSFKNEAVKLNATVLYADLADSTKMVDSYKRYFAAEIYKTFLHCSAKIIRSEGGVITAYDGDRIMAVYIGDSKNTSAVRSAMKIRWAVRNIIDPIQKAQYSTSSYQTKHVLGIDTSDLFVAKTGIRGSNDLVWVGRAANYAAKLSSLPSSYCYITSEIYNNMNDQAKYANGANMWTCVKWTTFDNRDIYRSSYWWRID